jgi:hypothetical protein
MSVYRESLSYALWVREVTGFFSVEHTRISFCLTSTVITITNIVVVAKYYYIGVTKDFRLCFSLVKIPSSSATANCKRSESPRNFSKRARGSGAPTQDVTCLYDSTHDRLQRFPQRDHRSEQICTELGFCYTLVSPLV